MELFSLFTENLLSPPILFFFLGIISGILKSGLEVPQQISKYLAIYLMMAIGFKGGVAIANTANITEQLFQLFLPVWELDLFSHLLDTIY